MRIARFAFVFASLVASACASDGISGPSINSPITAGLSAVAAAPVGSVGDPNVTMRLSVTSSLPEMVSGGVCAQAVEGRTPTGNTWTDVTSPSFVCSALAVSLAPGATTSITAAADQARIRTLVGSGTTVLLRARSALFGASGSYALVSNEVSYQLP